MYKTTNTADGHDKLKVNAYMLTKPEAFEIKRPKHAAAPRTCVECSEIDNQASGRQDETKRFLLYNKAKSSEVIDQSKAKPKRWFVFGIQRGVVLLYQRFRVCSINNFLNKIGIWREREDFPRQLAPKACYSRQNLIIAALYANIFEKEWKIALQ